MPTRRLSLAFLQVAAIPFLLVLALGTPAASQDLTGFPEPKTAEEYAEEAREAENSPLFASDEPLAITLRTDIEWIRDTRTGTLGLAKIRLWATRARQLRDDAASPPRLEAVPTGTSSTGPVR